MRTITSLTYYLHEFSDSLAHTQSFSVVPTYFPSFLARWSTYKLCWLSVVSVKLIWEKKNFNKAKIILECTPFSWPNMTESQECDDQMLIEDDGLRCVVKMEPEAREISKRIILLIACLSALCDCLLLSVIGIYGQFIFWLFSTSFVNSLTRNFGGRA